MEMLHEVSELYAEKLGWSQIPNKTSQLIPNVDKHALIDHENNNFITGNYGGTRDIRAWKIWNTL